MERHGYDRIDDNVKRRAAYLAGHPGVTISHVENPWQWVATWTDEGNHCTLRDEELGGLLDQLDNLDLPAG